MAKRQRKGFFRSMVDFPTWMNVKGLRESGDTIAKTFKSLQEVKISDRRETFEEAMSRLRLTEKDIQTRMHQCYIAGWIYFSCAALLFLYGLYLLIFSTFSGFLIAWLLSVLAGVYAYREGFWYLQMKKKKLGCTFSEFVNFITGRK